jgi:hypothetical protein
LFSFKLKKNISRILFGFFFLVTIFFISACNTQKKQPLLSTCLTADEKADLEFFFRSLLFENYGAFVLFGSKPLCEMRFADPDAREEREVAFQKWRNSLTGDERAVLEATLEKFAKNPKVRVECERNSYSGWLAWEKVRKTLNIKRYILRIAPVLGRSGENIPGSYEVILANVQQTALVMAENYDIFNKASGIDFHPLEMVFELQNASSIFWKNVFAIPNHLAKGLLFGFGLKNSIFGDWRIKYWSQKENSELDKRIAEYLKSVPQLLSTVPVELGKGSLANFTIPMFGAVPGDETAEKYAKEKKKIEKIYRGRDLVEVTLQKLTS